MGRALDAGDAPVELPDRLEEGHSDAAAIEGAPPPDPEPASDIEFASIPEPIETADSTGATAPSGALGDIGDPGQGTEPAGDLLTATDGDDFDPVMASVGEPMDMPDAGVAPESVSDDLESGTCIEATNLEEDRDTDVPKPQFDLGTGWLTDPAVTTLPGTDGPMTSTSTESTTMEMSSSDSGTASTGVTTTDTDTDTDSEGTASGSTGSSGPATAGTAGL